MGSTYRRIIITSANHGGHRHERRSRFSLRSSVVLRLFTVISVVELLLPLDACRGRGSLRVVYSEHHRGRRARLSSAAMQRARR